MTHSETNDEEFVARYLESGDQAHLDELFSRHLQKVRSMVYSMTLNDADADDVTQEVFIRATRGLAGFRGRARFTTWLYRIAMNTTHSHLKKCAVTAARLADAPVDALETSGKERPDRVAMDRDLDIEIERALAGLTPPLRAAITLTILHDLSPREAARVEGCATATMYWRVHQARQLLRQELSEHVRS